MKRFRAWYSKQVAHNIGSKVIASIYSAFILGIVAFFWDKLDKYSFSIVISQISTFLKSDLTVPVWSVFLFGALVWILRRLVRKVRESKKPGHVRNPILDERIGSYSFEELYNILNTKRLRNRTPLMVVQHIPAPEETLLEQFMANYEYLRQGLSSGDKIILSYLGQVDRDDGGYLTDILVPTLFEYDLLSVDVKEHSISGREAKYLIKTYSLSEAGFKFADGLRAI